MKATSAQEVVEFKDIPNVGPAMIADFKLLGIKGPSDLKSKNAFALYQDICRITNTRHDPCVLDTFLAVVDFMNGAPPHPWWHYTSERKRAFPNLVVDWEDVERKESKQ